MKKIFFILSLLISSLCFAQTRVIVPFPPGGGTDLAARIIFNDVSERTGKKIVIENISGAGGDIGRQRAMRDNVLLFTPNSILISAHLDRLNFIPLEEFKPVIGIGSYPYLISGHPKFPIKSIQSLKELSRKHGTINIASAGIAGANNLIIYEIGKLLKINVEAIPHRGTPDAILTTISGNTPLMVSGIQGTEQYIISNKLRAVAVTTDTRDIILKNIPTVQESTGKKFNYPGWFGVVAPKKYDDKQAQEIFVAVSESLKDDNVKRKLTQLSVNIWSWNSEKFGQFLKQDDIQWKNAINAHAKK